MSDILVNSPVTSMQVEATITRRHEILVIVPGSVPKQELSNIVANIQMFPGVIHAEVQTLGTTEETQVLAYWHKNPLRRLQHWFKNRY